jgi:hypothetical protein
VSDLIRIGLAVLIAAAVWMTGRWAIKVLSQGGPDEPAPTTCRRREADPRTVCGIR